MVQLTYATPPISAMIAGMMVAVTSVSAACSQTPRQSRMNWGSRPESPSSRQAERSFARCSPILFTALSRIHFAVPHIVGSRFGITRCGAWHGGASSSVIERGATSGVAGVGGLGTARRSGSGACHRTVGERLDERPDRACLRRDTGQRATVAQLVRDRWGRWPARRRASGPCAGEERGGVGGRGDVARGAGGGPAELDLAAIASRDCAADLGLDLQVAAQQGAKKNGYR